jgi:hypothetical protein
MARGSITAKALDAEAECLRPESLKLVLEPNGLKWNHETTIRERAFRLFVRHRGEGVVAADVLMQRAEKFCGPFGSKLVASFSVGERSKEDRFVQMIDRTYGHLAPDAEEYERGLLDSYDARAMETEAVEKL